MLVITRKPSEGFVIETSDGPIVIRNGGKNSSGTKFLIDAPTKCPVKREELYEQSAKLANRQPLRGGKN